MKNKDIFVTHSSQETVDTACQFAARIKPGDIVALHGELGSGKTTFIKGIAKGLGVTDVNTVKSPTFVLMHVYHGRIPVYHFDLYRLDSQKDVDSIGLDEFLNDPQAVACVEWAEKADAVFRSPAYHIDLAIEGPSRRKIRISHSNSR